MTTVQKATINPYDTEAWNLLFKEAQNKKIEEARPIYERVISQFPSSGRFWRLYIEHEIKSKCNEKVEKLFQRCLIRVCHVDLWKLYLKYTRETKSNQPNFREKMAQAYNFALDKIGLDINSNTIWLEYINFLRSVETAGSYAESQRIVGVRRMFQKAVVSPVNNLDSLWKDYCQFESSINQALAKKMQEDKQKDYQNARRVAKEYELISKGINKNALAVRPRNSGDDNRQLELWKKYIEWEKENPLRVEDLPLVIGRVMFAYEQCLLCCALHPEVWIDAAHYLQESSRLISEKGNDASNRMLGAEVSSLFDRALSFGLHNCLLIYFCYADFEEQNRQYDKVHEIYKKALAIPDNEVTLVYIQYMRFVRRAEGMASFRNVFRVARQDTRVKYHAYIYVALVESHFSRTSEVPMRVLSMALDKFKDQIDFIDRCVNFATLPHDVNTTRIFFERILSINLSPDHATEVWDRFGELESNAGDLASIMQLEKRRLLHLPEHFPNKHLALFIDRFRFLDLLPCQPSELKSMGFKDYIKSTSHSYTSICTQLTIANDTNPENIHKKDKESFFTSQHSYSEHSTRHKKILPRTNQMLPFKPKIGPMDGSFCVPGGVFPPPPMISDLLTKLPPPESFKGPFIVIDKFLTFLRGINMPDEYVLDSFVKGSKDVLIDAGTQLSIQTSLVRKRKSVDGMADRNSDDEDVFAQKSSDNVFMTRQKKKVLRLAN